MSTMIVFLSMIVATTTEVTGIHQKPIILNELL